MRNTNQQTNRRFSVPIRGSIAIQEDSEQLPRQGISSSEFIFQIFISIEGSAIFVIPSIFKDVGYLLGVAASVGAGLLYVYMMHIYLWCDKQIGKKNNVENPSLYSLIDNVFENSRSPGIVSFLKWYLKYEIILSWTLTLSFNLFYATKNIQLILDYYHLKATDQFILMCLLIPSTLLAWLPNVKAIAFYAYFITGLIIIVLLQVLYYLLIIPQPEEPRVVMINQVSSLPNFIFTTFFIISLTPLLFPLKNEMKYPNGLRKTFGGLNLSILLIMALNTFFSLEAYFKLGDAVDENILANLPQDKTAVLTNCLFTVSLVGSNALSMFVVFHTIWANEFEKCFENSKHKKFYEYVTRTVLSWFIVLIAMVIPTFSLFINLTSCFSYPFDCILLPIILESVIVLNSGESNAKITLILLKNIVFGVICIAASLVAFYESVVEMLAYYDPTILQSLFA